MSSYGQVMSCMLSNYARAKQGEDLKTSVTNLQISVGNPEECHLEIIRKGMSCGYF